MLIADLAAFGAALTWSFGTMIAVEPARQLGAFAFTRTRMAVVFFMLSFAAATYGGWQTINPDDLPMLALSGFIGIFIGDTALFAGLSRLGPRRNSILFSTNAPLAAVLGYFFLDEILSFDAIIGCALVTSGVILSIIFGKRRDQVHQWEEVHGSLIFGVGIGLLAGLCQAVGAILAKPALIAGADPIAVSAIRVGVGAFCLVVALLVPGQTMKAKTKMNLKLFGRVALSGFLGMGIGMSLLLFALARESTGIVMTLSSMMPVLVLPILWYLTRERPATGAAMGAVLCVIGTGLIFLT
ncbi:MAG: DMT family transporter [Rhodospirillaceae bacterium]|nr:DMT family transporter [Rhodospirillaceae bacterium]MBL6941431.1 DMT family transporter [Rhodospirillales bacterium]